MKKLLTSIFILVLLSSYAFATEQISILLVDDDNYSSPDHIGRIETAITSAGYSYTLFNAQDSAASPTQVVMDAYDLVFWYNANDGKDAYFWNGTDTVNTELKGYLDNEGMVWAMGNDIIYDMFGGAPDTFYAGDFLYDYFGIQSYNVQSKVDDGGTGVPMLLKVPGQEIVSQDTINWYVSGLWYGDGCTGVDSTVALYEFGDASYVLAGQKTAFYYTNGTSHTVSTWFDAYYLDSEDHRTVLFKDILDHFNNIKYPTAIENPGVKGIPATYKIAQNYPNPFNPATTISYRLFKAGHVQVTVYNELGEKMAMLVNAQQPAGNYKVQFDASELNSGIYFAKFNINGKTAVRKMMFIK